MGLIKRLFQRRLPSSFAVLQVLITPARLNKIDSLCDDRRNLFSLAAQSLDMDEKYLMEIIAKRIGYPFISDISDHPDFSNLSFLTKNGISLEAFLSRGAIPKATTLSNDSTENPSDASEVVGAFCIDPASIENLLNKTAKKNIHITTWQSILNYLSTINSSAEEKSTKSASLDSNSSNLARHILYLMGLEVFKFEASACFLTFQPKNTSSNHEQEILIEPEYSFITKDGEKALGTIQIESATILEQYLSSNDFPLHITFENSAELENNFECEVLQLNNRSFQIFFKHPTHSAFISLNNTSNNTALTHQDPSQREYLLKKRRVLIIEDDENFATLISRYLSSSNYEISLLTSSSYIISYLEELPQLPEVIVCDVHMPNIRGDQIIVLLSQHSLLRHIPIIALTSDESADTEVELTRIGATAVIHKSKDPRILCAHLDRLFVS